MKNITKILLKTISWLLGGILMLLIALYFILQIPSVQNFVKDKAVTYVQHKIKTPFRIGNFRLHFFNRIELNDVYLQGQHKETILSAKKLQIDISLLALLRSKADVSLFQLDSAQITLTRLLPDSVFNFQYIVDAFVGKDTATQKADTSSSNFFLNLKKLDLNQVKFIYRDDATGNDLATNIGHLETGLHNFDIQSMNIDIPNLNLEKSSFVIRQYTPLIKVPEDTTLVDTATLNIPFKLGSVNVDQFYVGYKDDPGAMSFTSSLGKLRLLPGKIDLTHLNFAVDSLLLADANMKVEMGKSQKQTSVDTSATIFHILSNKLDLQRVNLIYNDLTAPIVRGGMDYSHLDFKNIKLQTQNLDLTPTKYKGEILQASLREKGGLTLQNLTARFVYTDHGASLGNLYLKTPSSLLRDTIAVSYPSLGAIEKNPAKMYLWARLKNTTIAAKDILAVAPMMRLYMSGYTNSVFRLNTTVKGYVDNLSIPNLELNGLKNTYVKMSGWIKGLPNADNLKFNIQLASLRTSLADIKSLVPSNMAPQLSQLGNGPISLSGGFVGDMHNLQLQNVALRGLSNTYIRLNGSLLHYDTPKRAYFDIRIPNAVTSKQDILALVPAEYMPKNQFRIPNRIQLNGYFKGGMSKFSTNLALNTTNGWAKVLASLNKNGNYKAHFETKNLDLGYLLLMDTIVGKMTLTADAAGEGLDFNHFNLDRLVSNYSIDAQHLDLYGYPYKNLIIDGNLSNSIAHAKANINDSNIRFNFLAGIDMKPKYPKISLVGNLDTLNLLALKLSDSKMNVKAGINANFQSTNPDQLIGEMVIRNLSVETDSMHLMYDSLYVKADHKDSLSSLTLGLDSIMRLHLEGIYKLTEMGYAVQNNLYPYYHLPNYKITKVAPQDWTLSGYLAPGNNFDQIIPNWNSRDSVTLSGALKTIDTSLSFQLKTPQLTYADYSLRNVNLSVFQSSDSLKIQGFSTEMRNPSFNLFGTGFDASMRNNHIRFEAGTLDSLWMPIYGLGADLDIDTTRDYYRLHLHPDGLILNYDTWHIPDSNIVIYDGKKGIFAHDFAMQSNEQSISLNSVSDSANAPLDVFFDKFKLSTLTHIANTNEYPIEGTINGSAQLRNLLISPVFVSDLRIDSVAYGNQQIGNLALNVSNEKDENIYNVEASLEGNQSNLTLKGNYLLSQDSIDLVLNADPINLALLKPFSMGQLKESGGLLKGAIKINGPLNNFAINGDLGLDSAYLRPTMTGTVLRMPNDHITFDNNGIHFSNFNVLDSSNNKFVVDGDLLTKNYTDYAFDLKLKARNFMPINTPKSSNRFFYGILSFNTDMTIKGNLESPIVDGTVHVNKETNFALLMPTEDPEALEREGVVLFTDKNHPVDTVKLFTLLDSMSRKSQVEGMDVNLTISTDTSAVFSLVLDERTDDALIVSGSSNLAFGMDKSGMMSLTGDYELTKGSYTLSLEQIINKKFDIQRGSKITWTGDPLSAVVDITANYNQKAAPIDLIQQQLGSSSNRTIYNQSLPFVVGIHLTDQLMSPAINFDISLGSDYLSQYPLVDTKLQQLRTDPSETNKQVFALLLLGRFIGENPLQSASAATSAGDMALQTGSKILSDQLNKLAASLVQGVDLNFNLSTGMDYSSGSAVNKTDLAVGMSKNLFDDRIELSIGSDFALGNVSENQQAANIAGDVRVNYKLSRDGRYLLRAYRKNQYEGVIEGQVVRTGLGFAFTLDYNKFKEIFMTAAQRQKEARKRRRALRNRPATRGKGKRKHTVHTFDVDTTTNPVENSESPVSFEK